jgi:hypothetical protein
VSRESYVQPNDVDFWHLADIILASLDVRRWELNGHRNSPFSEPDRKYCALRLMSAFAVAIGGKPNTAATHPDVGD